MYCKCGCGKQTSIHKRTNKVRGWVKGSYSDFCHGHHGPYSSTVNILNRYAISDNGCWIWSDHLDKNGYAQANLNGKTIIVHRYFYESHKGIIVDGLVLDHLCRNKACVNPDHLEAVDIKTNIRRGLLPKLTPNQVSIIKTRYKMGETQKQLAYEYNVSSGTVNHLINRRTWKEIPTAIMQRAS